MDGAAELLALVAEGERLLIGALRQTKRHRRRADPLAVIGVHQAREAAPQPFRRGDHHRVRHFQTLEDDLDLGDAAQPHGRFTLADDQAFRRAGVRVAHREEAADALLEAVLENPRENEMQPRDAAAGNPVLLAVDDPIVALSVGPRGHLAGSAAGIRFGDADRRLIAAQHHLGRYLALVVVAIFHHRADRAHIAFHGDPPGDAAYLGHFHDQQHRIEKRAALTAKFLRNGHADEPGVAQRRDVLPRILLAAVDFRGARRDDGFSEFPGACLEVTLFIGQ